MVSMQLMIFVVQLGKEKHPKDEFEKWKKGLRLIHHHLLLLTSQALPKVLLEHLKNHTREWNCLRKSRQVSALP